MTPRPFPTVREAARDDLSAVRESLGALAHGLMGAYDALGEGEDARPGLLDALDRVGDLAACLDALARLLDDGRADR